MVSQTVVRTMVRYDSFMQRGPVTSLHGYVRLGYQSHASSYWMHGERKFVHFYLFESFSRPFYKTNDAQAYFVRSVGLDALV